jgi:hypothetical protein
MGRLTASDFALAVASGQLAVRASTAPHGGPLA